MIFLVPNRLLRQGVRIPVLGDVAIVRKQEYASTGDTGVVLVNGDSLS